MCWKAFYRGIDVEEIVNGFIDENRFGFEESAYLLLLENYTREQLDDFMSLLEDFRRLPSTFVRDKS